MKKKLRQEIQTRRRQLEEAAIWRASSAIEQHLHTLLHSQEPCTVGLYHPFRNEPNILRLCSNPDLRRWEWALPVCVDHPDGDYLRFARYMTGCAMEAGKYGIPTPVAPQWVEPDLLLIPCLGFHREGARLGYGAGWYDKTLAHLRKQPLCVGVCYAEDEIGMPFADPHDRLMDAVVTQGEIIWTRP